VCDFLAFAGQSGGEEPEPVHSEHSEKDLYFSSTDGHHSNEQTSTSEAGTRSSSLDVEDSLQLQTPPPIPTTTFLPTKIIAAPLSVLARFHLPSPSGTNFFFFSCLFFSLYTFQENPTIVISRPFAHQSLEAKNGVVLKPDPLQKYECRSLMHIVCYGK